MVANKLYDNSNNGIIEKKKIFTLFGKIWHIPKELKNKFIKELEKNKFLERIDKINYKVK